MEIMQSGTLHEVVASRRDLIAQAIYRVRPYYLGERRSVMSSVGVATSIDWDSVPAFYQADCYDISAAVLAAIEAAA